MKTALTLIAGLAIGLTSSISSVEAYNGFVSDVRYGEHPYETRRAEQNRRKRIAKQIREFGYFTPDSDSYFHPLYAKNMQLHPFFRKGGVTFFQDGRYAAWRGYQDPIRAHQLSPDTYCSNFSYARVAYRGPAVQYHCY